MARRPSKNQSGFPESGDEFPMEDEPPKPKPQEDPVDPDEEEDDEIEEHEPSSEPTVAELQRQIQEQNAKHERDLAELRRNQVPATPKEPKAEPPKTDWKNYLFTNPEEAVAQIKKEAKDETAAEMRSQYERDQGQQRFWEGFYDKHKDLKDDDDLVKLTLNSNLATLANIPVADAMKKLADLTRERILRYSGGARPKGRKAFAEGSGVPSARRAAPVEAEVTSLADVIRARRKNRRATAA